MNIASYSEEQQRYRTWNFNKYCTSSFTYTSWKKLFLLIKKQKISELRLNADFKGLKW